ncbi:Nramp family divalent metal transporter [Pseudovibrio denitrificans]|nr:Nramp family divalent metal transporter [Pseudovibrio denitrificans]
MEIYLLTPPKGTPSIELLKRTKGMSLTEKTRQELTAVLVGKRRSLWSKFLFAGPAIIASIAYVDPGNYATNIQAGAGYGYKLLWVVLLANLIAMLFQGLSARLGIVTGKNLAELCRITFPFHIVIFMWFASELAAMATDLAEFLGGAIGISLLLNIPILQAMAMVGIITYLILTFDRFGFRPTELIIAFMVIIITLCFLTELLIVPVSWKSVFDNVFIPTVPDLDALTIVVGIIGATIMPHAIYLHSDLSIDRAIVRNEDHRKRLLKFTNIEVVLALGVAGFVNIAMVILAAGAFHSDFSYVADIESAYHLLTPLLGGAAAAVFLSSLITSGVSSSVVGTMAGQMIMQGFLEYKIPIWIRRLVTMIPAFVIVVFGVNATQALVLSQVVLSITLPVPMIALIFFVTRKSIMNNYAITPFVGIWAILGTGIVLGLNFVLLADVFGVPVPLYFV